MFVTNWPVSFSLRNLLTKMTGRNQSFQLTAVMQPTLDSHGHPFGNGISSDNDLLEDETEVYELRPRGREKVRQSTSRERIDDVIFITKDIQEGDTLNAIALQYCCSVSLYACVNSKWHLEGNIHMESFKIFIYYRLLNGLWHRSYT